MKKKLLQVEAVAELLPRINIRNTLITPVVGIVDSYFQPTPNVEVSRVFRLPLARFLSARDHESKLLTHLPEPIWTHLFYDSPGKRFGFVRFKLVFEISLKPSNVPVPLRIHSTTVIAVGMSKSLRCRFKIAENAFCTSNMQPQAVRTLTERNNVRVGD